MAKETNVNEVVQLLQEAQQNKELVEAMVVSLEKFVTNQRAVLNDLEVLIANAKTGDLKVKKRGGYRGRKNKTEQSEG